MPVRIRLDVKRCELFTMTTVVKVVGSSEKQECVQQVLLERECVTWTLLIPSVLNLFGGLACD